MMCNWELITLDAAGLLCRFDSKSSKHLLNFRLYCRCEDQGTNPGPAGDKENSHAHAEPNSQYISRTLVIKCCNVTEALTVFVYDRDSIIAL